VASEFRDLVAYRKSVAFADEMYEQIARWPKFDRWSAGIQLMRAADSVGANIAEAAGRWHRPDQRRFLLMARGSLHETEHWIARAEARGLLARGSTERLAEVARTLNGLIAKWGSG
jgi:four helix bundle protein